MELPKDWTVPISDQQAEGLQAELQKELPQSHPLKGFECRTVAICQFNDDVLFKINLPDFQYALVHLTWRGRVEAEGWPSTELFSNYQKFLDSIKVNNSDTNIRDNP